MHIIEFRQIIPGSLAQCWDFFATPGNLQKLTPPHLGFKDNAGNKPMYEGQIIIHQLTPMLGIPWQWVTEITHVKHHEYFIDEQRFGPYKFWHHEHRFSKHTDGVEVIDLIHYKLPLGVFGKTLNALKVAKDLGAIFSYRQKKIIEIFGSKPTLKLARDI